MTDRPIHMRHMPDFVTPVTPIVIDHAEGSWVYATDGTKWLDFVMGIAVMNTGHAHPKIIEAVKAQAARVSHAQMNIYRHQPMLDLSDKLAEIVPEGMDTFVYTNSGAESVENAVKLAKQVTRRPGIIAFHGAFHGRTHLTMALTDSAVHYRGHHEPLVGGVYHARYCYPYRTPASEDPTAYAIEDVRRVLRSEIYGDDVAAIIVEPIQGEGGFIVPTKEFMLELRAIADEIGACLIIDEIQAGMGRTGKWFCHEHYGVKPDIVTIAKGIASGYPLGAIVAPKALWDKCLPGSMGGTYGGNAVACAAAMATLDVIEDEDLVENARVRGRQLLHGLRGITAGHATVGDVRGIGLMVALEFVRAGDGDGRVPDAALTKRVQAACFDRGLLLLTAGTYVNVIRIIPPLVTTAEEVDLALGIIAEALDAAGA